MPIWQAKMDSVFYDDYAAFENDPCEVRIDGNVIVVSYENDDGPAVYSGAMKGPGHFELNASKGNGRATLHMFEGSDILEGYWREDGDRGFWRIYLSN